MLSFTIISNEPLQTYSFAAAGICFENIFLEFPQVKCSTLKVKTNIVYFKLYLLSLFITFTAASLRRWSKNIIIDDSFLLLLDKRVLINCFKSLIVINSLGFNSFKLFITKKSVEWPLCIEKWLVSDGSLSRKYSPPSARPKLSNEYLFIYYSDYLITSFSSFTHSFLDYL